MATFILFLSAGYLDGPPFVFSELTPFVETKTHSPPIQATHFYYFRVHCIVESNKNIVLRKSITTQCPRLTCPTRIKSTDFQFISLSSHLRRHQKVRKAKRENPHIYKKTKCTKKLIIQFKSTKKNYFEFDFFSLLFMSVYAFLIVVF